MKQEPHGRVLKLLGNMKNMPDELFVYLRKNFRKYGNMLERVRKFEEPSFRPQALGKPRGGFGNFDRNYGPKKYNPKKSHGKRLSRSTRKNLVL